jgi:hypothetical protein
MKVSEPEEPGLLTWQWRWVSLSSQVYSPGNEGEWGWGARFTHLAIEVSESEEPGLLTWQWRWVSLRSQVYSPGNEGEWVWVARSPGPHQDSARISWRPPPPPKLAGFSIFSWTNFPAWKKCFRMTKGGATHPCAARAPVFFRCFHI